MAKSIRIPLAEPLTNRDSTASKDSKLTNCFMQNVGGQSVVVKRPGTLAVVQDTVGQGQGTYCYNSLNWGVSGNTLAQNSVVYGSIWTSTSGFPSRYNHATVLFNNKLWLIAGIDGSGGYLNDVWSSPDGINWTQTTAAAAFSARQAPTAVVLGGFMYIIGGYSTGYLNDVWKSSDGITWTQVTAAAAFPARYFHTSVVFNNLMWVLGGAGTIVNNDAWSSPDGITWTQVTQIVAYPARQTSASVVTNGLMYIIGGGDSNGIAVNTVYSSPDGATWTLTNANPPWNFNDGRAQLSATIFKSNIYITGGFNSSAVNQNDVWSSPDGVTWSQSTVTTPYYAVHGNTSGVLNNTLFVLGGTGSTGISTNTWSTSGSTTSQQIAPTYYPLAVDNLPYNFSQVGSATSPLLVLKNNNQMYLYNFSTGAVTKVTSANYPTTTVSGLVYLDGTFYVATSNGKIWGSAIEDPTTWSALNYTSAEIEPDGLVAIEKSLNYLVAFGQWTTEFFYDAGNPTGSPLSSVPNAFFTVGCASGTSVVRMENEVVWMSQTIQRGRQIMSLSGFTPSIISTPEVDRILNSDDLATVYAFSIKISGSVFYVITLKTSAKTLVYDFSTKQWHFWTSMTAQAAKSVTTITSSNAVATVTQTAHGYADGDLITISGASPAAYNGSFNITYVDANTYTYPVPLGTASPATGTITAMGYTESYFNAVAYSFCLGGDIIQGESDGKLYKMNPSYYDDNGTYINTKIKTVRIDGGESKRKFVSKAEIIGDKVSATGLLRYTDDDYVTYSVYRPIDMNAKRSMLLRGGHTRRRAYEFRCTASVPLRIESLELDVEPGTS